MHGNPKLIIHPLLSPLLSLYPGLFCKKIGAGTHFQTFGAEKFFSHRSFQKFDFAILEKNWWPFLFAHYSFVYYPPFIQHFVVFNQGRRPRGTGGTVPPKIWGGGTADALVPPIFKEVVLSDACESINRVKKVFFLWGKGQIWHLT